VVGLIDAFSKFDHGKQVQFKSYAQFRIRGAILDSLRSLDWSPRELRRKGRAVSVAVGFHDGTKRRVTHDGLERADVVRDRGRRNLCPRGTADSLNRHWSRLSTTIPRRRRQRSRACASWRGARSRHRPRGRARALARATPRSAHRRHRSSPRWIATAPRRCPRETPSVPLPSRRNARRVVRVVTSRHAVRRR